MVGQQRDEGSRVAGKQVVDSHEQSGTRAGRPRFIAFNTCVETIQAMETPTLDDKKPECVDTAARDQSYDMLRYGLREFSDAPALPPWVIDRNEQTSKVMHLPTMI